MTAVRGPQALAKVDVPPLPALTKDGAYDPVELVAFMRACNNAQMRIDHVALALNVPIHRITYLQKGGLVVIQKRARTR